MEHNPAQEFLEKLTPLTGPQFDNIKSKVKLTMLKNIGEEPNRDSVKKDMGPLFSPEDWLAAIVFIASFVVSMIHIMTLVGKATVSLAEVSIANGITIPQNVFIMAHQVAFVCLAEFAMILFMVRWRLGVKRRKAIWEQEEGEAFKMTPGRHLGNFVSIDLGLALLAAGFILYANLESKLPILESIMPPLFTIGIGIHLEHIFVEMLHRRKTLSSLLSQKITTWQIAVDEVTNSQAYKRLMIRTMWEGLMSIPGNAWAMNVPNAYKWAAVERELHKENWFDQHLAITDKSPQALVSISNGEWGLPNLIEAVVTADENARDRIEIGQFWVDLEELTWFNPGNKKHYGPYSTKSRMVGGMKMALERGGIQTSGT